MSGWLTSGAKVREFESLFAEKHHVARAIAVTSCTAALHLALNAVDVKPGDEVIVPAFTWVATANAVLFCGAKPVFVDIELNSFNLDPTQLTQAIGPKTKAIIPVHLFGLCANMDEIKKHSGDIILIEDAACASGAAYKSTPAGGLGKIGCFSFHPRKSITTGEGGMLTTNNEELADYLIKLRNHGASISEEQRHHGPKPYLLPEFNFVGFNYRMTDLQGALGVVQLQQLEHFIEFRATWAEFYHQQLSEIDWIIPPQKMQEDYKHGWQSYVTLVDPYKAPISRNQIMERLQERGISTRPGTHAVHMLGYYQKTFGLRPEDFPNSRHADLHSMAIPLHNRMDQEDFQFVVDTLKEIS